MALIMVVASTLVMISLMSILYYHDIAARQDMLQVTAQSQARLMEAVARFDRIHSPSESKKATISQIIDAHEQYRGFGRTGEFTLARRDGNKIVFIFRHGQGYVDYPKPVAFKSVLAEPMRRALQGKSGRLVGLDYRGVTVLAAYEPVASLDLGIVAKVDLAEFREPYIRSGLVALLVAVLVITAGLVLFFRISDPIMQQLYRYSQGLAQKVAEAEQLNSRLESKNTELEQLIYVASHDLRSPLVNIDGYSRELELAINALRQALENERITVPELNHLITNEIPETLQFIKISASKMEALINGLLRLSRLGRASLVIDTLDMNELISRVIAANEFQLKKAKVTLDVTLLPPCMGDANQVDQVFTNLLANALRYLDPKRPGAIHFSAAIEAARCVYCVEDNGIGIAPEQLQSIFKIFHRVDPANGEGEGLGLSIVQRAVALLEGDVWVESEVGEGSRFYVALPLG